MFDKCPCCGSLSFKKQPSPAGNALFICSFEEEKRNIIADQGIMCDYYLCYNCGSIQLRAKPAN